MMKKTIQNILSCTPGVLKRMVPVRIKDYLKGVVSKSEEVGSGLERREEGVISESSGVSDSGTYMDMDTDMDTDTGEDMGADMGVEGEGLDIQWIDEGEYEVKWGVLFGHRQEEYFKMHRRRYYELLNTAYGYLSDRENPLVLEIGVSEFAVFYKEYFPGMRLVTVDRPRELNGFTAEYCLGVAHAERHYHIDLNQAFLSPEYGEPVLGYFDYIICTEVLEHLIVNPVEFISSLLGLLVPGGVVYLTTPNFFRYDNLEKMKQGRNPQMVFPGWRHNGDAHHHFREYDMNELLEFVLVAGGEVLSHGFSGCWDPQERLEGVMKHHPDQKSNIVLTFARKGEGRAQSRPD